VDKDGFGPTPHQAKTKKKHQAYQDRHLQPIGENVEVMRHSETIRVEFRYFCTPVSGEACNPVPLLYELVKKMFSAAPSTVLKSVNNEKPCISKLEGFPNGFEVEEFFKVVYNIHAICKTGKIFVYFKLFSMLGIIHVDTLKQKPGFMNQYGRTRLQTLTRSDQLLIDGNPFKGDTIAINWIRLWTISESLTQSTR
jgi:hypothetical protein